MFSGISIRVRRIQTIANLSTLQAPSLTSFLTDSCGLSPAAAINRCIEGHLHLQKPKGHRQAQPRLRPHLLRIPWPHSIADRQALLHAPSLPSSPTPPGRFQPKIDFYLAAGFSPSTLTKLISADAYILLVSLNNRIIPCFDFLKAILHTNEDVVAAVKRSTWMLRVDLKNKMAPNIETFAQHRRPHCLHCQACEDLPFGAHAEQLTIWRIRGEGPADRPQPLGRHVH
ncbi:hypothetical protein J5N97_013527 [Dioscorea zingiberensis]|uniref:Uncharacterized protein n=1 Tax=Dioscorea zingiberensis TaxID=325984 RepID=A0A9D5CTE8_9LILI|nr:hypothetical protein J5N97_013527 [Dioscorea zingiberensis]